MRIVLSCSPLLSSCLCFVDSKVKDRDSRLLRAKELLQTRLASKDEELKSALVGRVAAGRFLSVGTSDDYYLDVPSLSTRIVSTCACVFHVCFGFYPRPRYPVD